jgi:hypothetical protein
VLAQSADAAPHEIDVARTSQALQIRVDRGDMSVLRGDVSLSDMLPLVKSDLKYTVVAFLRCERCERTRFWGLCVRGAPTYKVVDAAAPRLWRWSEVPPRGLWA